MWVGALLVVTILVVLSDGQKIDPRFIVDYYNYKNIEQIVVLACWDESDVVDYHRRVDGKNLRSSYITIGDDDEDNNVDIERILRVNYYKIGVVLDMDCPKSSLIFDQLWAAKLPFNDSYHYIGATSASELPIRELERLSLSVESEFTLAMIEKLPYALYDVYSHSTRHGAVLNVTRMGSWDEGRGFINHLTQYKYKRRQDFHGMTLNFTVALTSDPKPDLETYLLEPVNPHLDTMSRFHYSLILQLRDFYNFNIHLTRTNSWGYLINGTFNGILGDMTRGITDISASPLYYKAERMDVCEYTVETFIVDTCFVFRHPKKNTLKNAFLKPFTQNVWWLSLNVGVMCWILLLIIMKIENRYDVGDETEVHKNPSSETALITIAAFTQQGAGEEPRFLSGRIVFVTLFLWTLMMYQFYSADIVGSLIAAPPKFINTLKELVDSDLHLAVEETPYSRDYYRTTKDPSSLYLYRKKLEPKRKKKTFTDPINGLRQVHDGGYAFFSETTTSYKIIEETFTQAAICELSEIKVIPPMYVSLVTSKKSPFKKMVTYGLRKIVEHGLSRRMTFIWRHRKPSCPESFRSQPVAVEITEASPAMFLVAGGFVLAGFIVASEHLTMKYRRRRRCGSSTPAGDEHLEHGQVTNGAAATAWSIEEQQQEEEAP